MLRVVASRVFRAGDLFVRLAPRRARAVGGRNILGGTKLSQTTQLFAKIALVPVLLALHSVSAAFAAEIDYEFNAKGQLVTAEYSDGTTVTYEYDENGNRRSVSSAGGPDIKAPTIPNGVVATVISSTRIDLSWTASADGGSSGLQGYKVERCSGAACLNFSLVNTRSAPPFQNTGLAANAVYRYRVQAYDVAGNHSSFSSIISATTLADTVPPSAPGTLTATVQSSTRIDLSWLAATDSGGSGLAGYRIERCAGATCTNWAQIAQQSGRTYQDSNRAANTAYRYRVRAYDNAGNNSASYSNIASGTTSQDTSLPTAPTNLAATASSASRISLSWTASTDAGGSGLAGYRIERCSGASCTNYSSLSTSAAVGFTDDSVAANTTYRYRVRAYDNAGNNSATYSNVASATTPQDTTRPSAPATATATAASSTRINVSWGQSTDSGNNLTGYRVERCVGASCTGFALRATVLASDPNGRTYADTGVSPLTTYLYRVQAYDAAGNTSNGYSPNASATTPADTTAPSAPALSVTPSSSTQLNISWTASTDTGGAGLAGYKLERCQGLGCSSFSSIATLSSTTTVYSDTGRAAATAYVYRIRAYDNATPTNHSTYSANVAGTTLADTAPPTAPTSLSAASVSSTRIDLSWAASTDSGGAGLAGYEIERCQGVSCASFAPVATASATTYSNVGLSDGKTYTYRVRAFDAAATPNRSGWSNSASASTPDASPPTPPSSLSFPSVTADSGVVEWGSGSDNVEVTGYRHRVNGGGWTVVGKTVTSAAYTGLTCATLYTVEVQAGDAAGYWSVSRSASFTTLDNCVPGPPGAPSFPSKTNTSVTASWGAASDNVGVIGYYYRRTGIDWVWIGNVLSVTFNGLFPNTTYTFEVQAADAAGNRSSASSASVTTHGPPSAPTGSCSGGKPCANQNAECAWTATWNATTNATYYLLRNYSSYSPNEFRVDAPSTSYVYSCPYGEAYNYRPRWLKACNDWGCSGQASF